MKINFGPKIESIKNRIFGNDSFSDDEVVDPERLITN